MSGYLGLSGNLKVAAHSDVPRACWDRTAQERQGWGKSLPDIGMSGHLVVTDIDVPSGGTFRR
jgi:hypothetical protein